MKQSIKLISFLLLSNLVYAADNSIYIDQAGDNSTIDVLQDGGGNTFSDVTTVGAKATLSGNSQVIDVKQVGGSNTLKIGIQSTVDSGIGVDLTYYITGSNSTAELNLNDDGQGTLANLVFDVRQTGDNNDLFANILGTGNSVTATATGGDYNDFNFTINADGVTVSADVSGGGGNTTTLNLTSDDATVDLTSVGASNTYNITQSGLGGITGHSITLDVTGSSNTLTSSQSGSIDTTIDITSSGNGNTWSITTSD